MQNLTTLKLNDNKISEIGVTYLCNSETLKKLIKLNLNSNSFGYNGAQNLANAKSL